MKKASHNKNEDDLRPEYDFSKFPPPVRGKYARRYHEGTNLVRLDADVAGAFPSEESVNKALRSLMDLAKASVGSSR